MQSVVIHINVALGHSLPLKPAQKSLGRGRAEQQFGGDAAAIEADAAHLTALDQSDGFSATGKYACGLCAAWSAADDDNIKCIHAAYAAPSAPPESPDAG